MFGQYTPGPTISFDAPYRPKTKPQPKKQDPLNVPVEHPEPVKTEIEKPIKPDPHQGIRLAPADLIAQQTNSNRPDLEALESAKVGGALSKKAQNQLKKLLKESPAFSMHRTKSGISPHTGAGLVPY